MVSMGTISPSLYHTSGTQKLHINKVSRGTTTVFCSPDHHDLIQIPKNLSSGLNLSAKNGKFSGIIEKESVFLNSQSSSKMQDGLGIIEFFSEKKLLITGATGFLAKVLVEKILRTMPEVGKIFLLIKAKNEEAADERLMNEIINTELFKCLRQKHGTFYERFMLSKLVPVAGNMCETNIGMEENVANLIAREVDVIINSAATTAFDERFDLALDLNTRGAAGIVNFAKKCEKVKLYVHLSTAYATRESEGKIVEESFGKGHYIASSADIYEAQHKHVHGLDIEAEIKLAFEMKESFKEKENESDQKLKDLGMNRAQKYGWANTYSFTKAMGEMVVEDTKGHLPVIIIRPSVIESTLKEPFPGWIEGNRMLDPFFLLYGKGKLPGFYINPNMAVDVVPADIVVNSILAAIAKHGREESRSLDDANSSSDDHVYQITSSFANPLIARDLADMVYQHFSSSPCFDNEEKSIHVSPFKLFTSLEDMLSAIVNTGGKKLIRRRAVEHFKYMADLYQHYSFFGGRFDNNKAEKLIKCMSKEERKEFGLDVGSIDWKDYFISVHFPGIRKHVMKEN
ncbi:fatty acyl-CoA reductase 2, chloroplastic-like [Apium graveolens]|uniref:fatty acyl-CoA reductase 2, chloroplastic-like n=1 Tax=Apium graveolens TaxID=4045 RepID=UPI003D78FD1E